jgi:hypothetical protein
LKPGISPGPEGLIDYRRGLIVSKKEKKYFKDGYMKVRRRKIIEILVLA